MTFTWNWRNQQLGRWFDPGEHFAFMTLLLIKGFNSLSISHFAFTTLPLIKGFKKNLEFSRFSGWHEDYKGELINLFVSQSQVVYCGQLTNESARFL